MLLLLLASSPFAAADSEPAAPTDPKLAQLVGRWEGKAKFTTGGKTSELTFSTTCERTTAGPAIACTSVGTGATVKLEEVWLLGYDRHTASYRLFSVNNWGEAYDHAASWTDPAQASFVHTGRRGGKPLREEYRLTFKKDELTVYGILTVGAKTIGEGTTVLRRVP